VSVEIAKIKVSRAHHGLINEGLPGGWLVETGRDVLDYLRNLGSPYEKKLSPGFLPIQTQHGRFKGLHS
jgi:hypothetical protein